MIVGALMLAAAPAGIGAMGADLPTGGTPPSVTPPAAAPPASTSVETPVPGNPKRSDVKEENKEIVDLADVHGLLGKEVRSATGEPMGRIVNVLVDDAGKPRAAVIDFGGFLGVGVRKIAVDWKALQFSPYQTYERVTVALTRDQVRAAPEFKDEQPTVQAIGISGATSGSSSQ
jgi:hypothetical protein